MSDVASTAADICNVSTSHESNPARSSHRTSRRSRGGCRASHGSVSDDNAALVEAAESNLVTTPAMKAALRGGDPAARDYLRMAISRLSDHPEQCAHLVNQLSMHANPAFIFSLTTTLTANKATITMVGRGGNLNRAIKVRVDGPAKQTALQAAYVAFVVELCSRSIRGPSAIDRVLTILKRATRTFSRL